MRIEQLRKDALIWSIFQGTSDHVVDSLLNVGVAVPEIIGDFHITLNGVPGCLTDLAFSGGTLTACQHSSLNRSILSRDRLKDCFPQAIVAVKQGRCPNQCSKSKAA